MISAGRKEFDNRNMKENENKYALLIDADNVSAKYIKPILDELSKYGNVTYKRIYGDWTTTHNASWKEVLLENSIMPIQQYSYTQGKNATDSAMIIDAMDILYTGKVDGFCIVSSDSDFTRLASRLRESGQNVIGMGEEKTPTAFRQACNIFTTLELLLSDEEESAAVSKNQIEEAVIKIITENQNNGRETGLAEVGNRLVKLYPDFDVRGYGYSMLYKFLETFPKLKIIREGTLMTVTLYEDPGKREGIEKYIVDEVKKSGKQGLSLGTLGQRIHTHFKDFQVRDYGYSQLKNYIASIPYIHTEGEGNQITIFYEEEKLRRRRK
ncbi:MAG: NYN domain-containing protein [Eubacteriales bacterium]|nr:NYN domain-containing protein [Eubacteriales bacterium]